MVSDVKICKQCLQTASSSGGLRSTQTPYRGFALGPHWGTSVLQTPWAIVTQMKIPRILSTNGTLYLTFSNVDRRTYSILLSSVSLSAFCRSFCNVSQRQNFAASPFSLTQSCSFSSQSASSSNSKLQRFPPILKVFLPIVIYPLLRPIACSFTTWQSLVVHGSVEEYDRLSQPSWLMGVLDNIVILTYIYNDKLADCIEVQKESLRP